MKITKETVLHATPFLELVMLNYVDHNEEEKVWYGVRRNRSIPAVAIAALTQANELILVKQNRPMVGGETIELPAGLMDKEGESILEVGRRELLEETGYTGDNFSLLVGGKQGLTVTAGLTDERLFLVQVRDVRKIAQPDRSEGTSPILIPLSEAYDWLTRRIEEGKDADYKLFGTIRLLEREALR